MSRFLRTVPPIEADTESDELSVSAQLFVDGDGQSTGRLHFVLAGGDILERPCPPALRDALRAELAAALSDDPRYDPDPR